MANGGRDIVVIGGSSGSLAPLLSLLEVLPAELPAAVFVVVHRLAEGPFLLPEILSDHCRLAISTIEDGDPIELGRLYVAPPDKHLMVKADVVRVVHGPKENGFRPAIDPLFRTAAASYGNRVIGIILSGTLDDGAHGLLKIKRAGGLALVQDPSEAEYPEMPEASLERVQVDHVITAAKIDQLLPRLISEEVELTMPHPRSQVDVSEGVIGALRLESLKKDPTPLICPDCGGSLWEIDNEGMPRYRCHVGHGFTAETLASMQSSESEKLLWGAIRTLEEQAELQRRLARQWQDRDNPSLYKRFVSNAQQSERTADLLRAIADASEQTTPAPDMAEEEVVSEYRGGR